jgi:hypothetical protein
MIVAETRVTTSIKMAVKTAKITSKTIVTIPLFNSVRLNGEGKKLSLN